MSASHEQGEIKAKFHGGPLSNVVLWVPCKAGGAPFDRLYLNPEWRRPTAIEALVRLDRADLRTGEEVPQGLAWIDYRLNMFGVPPDGPAHYEHPRRGIRR